jgi:DNA repair photolyase
MPEHVGMPSLARLTLAPRALRRGAMPEPFSCGLYACAAYRGCAHACAYCDGRAEKYFVEGDFSNDVVARSNLPELLDAELGRLSDRGAVSLGSGVSDSYQRAEAELGITGACARVLAARGWPAVLITKSDLVLKDADAWAAVASASACQVSVTVTTLDESVRAAFEPGAVPSERRLEAIGRLKEGGCSVGVLAMPLLPYIGDSDDAFRAILRRAKAAGASFVMPGGLTLRPGRQKEHFFSVLAERDPGLVEPYRRLYAEERASGIGTYAYRAERSAAWDRILLEEGMPGLLPHAIHRRLLSPPDSLFILFCHMAELYQRRGIDARALRAATGRYAAWLAGLRARARRSKPRSGGGEAEAPGLFDAMAESSPVSDGPCRGLCESPVALLARAGLDSGDLERVIDNPKLFEFARRVLADGEVFDYSSLKLT